jgi:hypothetical protein
MLLKQRQHVSRHRVVDRDNHAFDTSADSAASCTSTKAGGRMGIRR